MRARMLGRTIAAVSGTVALCALGAGTASAQDPAPDQLAPAVQEIDLLFSQSGRSGSLKPRAHGRGQILVLRGVSETVWFENRPGRQSGDLPTAGFAGAWSGFGFEADPPNAALSVLKGEGRATSVVELYNPRFDAAADRLRFRAHPLGQTSGRPQRFPRHFQAASLFIDDATAPVISSCVIQPWTDCGGANLSGANLTGAVFQNADLTRANLSGANLYNANLDYAHLGLANLTGASASEAGFAFANLTAANLTNTNLTDADLSTAVFDLANLTGANLTGVDVYNIDVLQWLDVTLCNTTMPDATKNNRDC